MKNIRVEFTEKENNYTFTGEWYEEVVEAETKEEAIEIIKSWLTEQGEDCERFIYR